MLCVYPIKEVGNRDKQTTSFTMRRRTGSKVAVICMVVVMYLYTRYSLFKVDDLSDGASDKPENHPDIRHVLHIWNRGDVEGDNGRLLEESDSETYRTEDIALQGDKIMKERDSEAAAEDNKHTVLEDDVHVAVKDGDRLSGLSIVEHGNEKRKTNDREMQVSSIVLIFQASEKKKRMTFAHSRSDHSWSVHQAFN